MNAIALPVAVGTVAGSPIIGGAQKLEPLREILKRHTSTWSEVDRGRVFINGMQRLIAKVRNVAYCDTASRDRFIGLVQGDIEVRVNRLRELGVTNLQLDA